jgi:diacylglycerol kinase family enzyme
MQMRIGVVINHSAGSPKDRSLRKRIEELLGAGAVLKIHSASHGAGLRAAANRSIQEGCNVLVAAGGDGTVSSLAALLAGTGMTLGVLPVGTLNHFARDLGIPSDLNRASQVILAGHSTLVDVGELNGRFFINNSSLGLYPSIVRRRERSEKTGTSRLLAFAAAIVFALRRYPFLDAHIRVDGNEIDRRSPFFFIGNNHYEVEGLRLGRRSSLNGGSLSLYTAHRTGRVGLLRIAVSALLRRLRRNHDFEILAAHELQISTRRKRLAVALDGEVVHMTPPLQYSIRAGALRVMVPA